MNAQLARAIAAAAAVWLALLTRPRPFRTGISVCAAFLATLSLPAGALVAAQLVPCTKGCHRTGADTSQMPLGRQVSAGLGAVPAHLPKSTRQGMTGVREPWQSCPATASQGAWTHAHPALPSSPTQPP